MLFVVAITAYLISYDSSIKSGMPARTMEATRVDYVAQAAMQHAVWQKDNYACGSGFTIPVTAFGENSYTATITSGATTTSNTFNPDRDAWLKEAAPDDNFGNESELPVKNKASNSFRALYHYDLSSVATGGTVQSATAWFYVTSNDDQGAVEIHAVTAGWTEPAVTWNNIGTSFDATVMGSIPLQVTNDVWVSVDITALAQQWVNDPAANNGIMLIATSSDVESKYTSGEYSSSLRPYLEVTTSVGEVSPVQISATGTLASGVSRTLARADVPAYKAPAVAVLQPHSLDGVDSRIWDFWPNTNYGTSDEVWVSSGSNNITLSLLKFNLEEIPTGVRVLSAKLSLKQRSTSDPDIPITAHRIFSRWTEDLRNVEKT